MFPQRAMSMPYRTLTVCVLMKKKSFVLLIKYFPLKAGPGVRCISRTFGADMIPVYCCMKNFGRGTGGWTLAMKTDGTEVYTLHSLAHFGYRCFT